MIKNQDFMGCKRQKKKTQQTTIHTNYQKNHDKNAKNFDKWTL